MGGEVRRDARLTTINGSWTFAQLRNDPFRLLERSRKTGPITLSERFPEEIVCAVLTCEDLVPSVVLGRVDSDFLPASGTGTSWVFLSSGTTGDPKVIAHALSTISRRMGGSEAPPATWGLLTDITRMAGFQVVLEAIRTNNSLVVSPIDLPLAERVRFLLSNGVDHLSATPSQWRQIVSAKSFRRAQLRQITLAGEAADQRLLDKLAFSFPRARITHVYGTTEAGSVFAVHDKRAGFPRALLDRNGSRMEVSSDGELGVRFGDGGEIHWTGDIVEIVGDRYQFLGRRDDLINVGGAKVSPLSVETVLLAHPRVIDCSVRARRSGLLGQLVSAEVALSDGPQVEPDELREFCSKRLPAYAVPRFFSFDGTITYGPSGKKMRG